MYYVATDEQLAFWKLYPVYQDRLFKGQEVGSRNDAEVERF